MPWLFNDTGKRIPPFDFSLYRTEILSSVRCRDVVGKHPKPLKPNDFSLLLVLRILILCNMPEIFRIFGIRFFFFSNEPLPVHIQIRNGDGDAKFGIRPVRLQENNGMKSKDIHLAESIIEENEELIEQKWAEYFKK